MTRGPGTSPSATARAYLGRQPPTGFRQSLKAGFALWSALRRHPEILVVAEDRARRFAAELVTELRPFTFTMHWYGETPGTSDGWPDAVARFVEETVISGLSPAAAAALRRPDGMLRGLVAETITTAVWRWAEQESLVRDLGGPWNERRPASWDEAPRRALGVRPPPPHDLLRRPS